MTREHREDGCGGHAGLSAELSAVVLLALDRVTPVLQRWGSEPATGPSTCAACPVCAVLAAVRGERPELAVRLAEQAAGLLTAVRTLLHEDADPAAQRPAPERPVQHIRVERTGTPR